MRENIPTGTKLIIKTRPKGVYQQFWREYLASKHLFRTAEGLGVNLSRNTSLYQNSKTRDSLLFRVEICNNLFLWTNMEKPQKTCYQCHRPFYASYKGKYYCVHHLEDVLKKREKEGRSDSDWLNITRVEIGI